jgi:hypothetical protein
MEQILLYIGIALAAGVITTALLWITKIPAVVAIGTALIVGGAVVFIARIEVGFWDPLAPIAFVANAVFGFVVSCGLLAIGRWRRWRFFAGKHSGQQQEEP